MYKRQPIIFISAKTGQRVNKLFEMINNVASQNALRISTAMLNQVINEAIAVVQSPTYKMGIRDRYCDDANIDFSEKEINIIENYKNDLIERLKNIKTEKGIYYSNYINISRGKENDEDILIFTENEKYATTNEEEFYDNIYNKILLAQRDVVNENKRESAITVLHKNLIGESTVEKKYSINTMQEVKEV